MAERGWEGESLAEAWVSHWKSDEARRTLSVRGLEALSKAMEPRNPAASAKVQPARVDQDALEAVDSAAEVNLTHQLPEGIHWFAEEMCTHATRVMSCCAWLLGA